jgi:alginate O-acetyltransferase complex protein AlgI
VTFDSFTFVVFFAVVLLVDRALGGDASPRAASRRKSFLLAASALFYAAWNPPFVLLVAFSTVLDYVVMQKIAVASSGRARKAWLTVSLVINLSLLGFFKYGTFLVENTERLLTALGADVRFAAPDIILPVGISFYTFQTLSTTIDVYRRTLAAPTSLRDYALFVTFFPQLVAGPIVRGREFLPQLVGPRRATGLEWRHGLALMVIGLAMKVVLADGLFARTADLVFNGDARTSTLLAWSGVLAFSGQIFCDFAGYSLVAIGAALTLGFALPDNFRAPYAARGFSDFWRRWHITLSSWLRDYLYIPLGGNRHGRARTMLALVVTMLLGGLWHGAAWTFVVWGALHGAFLVVEHALLAFLAHRLLGMSARARVGLAFAGSLVTLFGVVLAWVPFRAPTFARAVDVMGALFGVTTRDAALGVAREATLTDAVPVVLFCALVVWQHMARHVHVEDVWHRLPRVVRALTLAFLAFLIVVSTGEDRAFLYFQF